MSDLNDESKDLFDAKDKQLENYLTDQIGNITSDISTLTTNYTNLVSSTIPWSYIRVGTAVFTLPAVGGSVTITYSALGVNDVNIQSSFSSLVPWKFISVTVSNGDPPTNPANLGCEPVGLTGFRVFHINNGVPTGGCRVNFHAIGFA